MISHEEYIKSIPRKDMKDAENDSRSFNKLINSIMIGMILFVWLLIYLSIRMGT